MIRTVLAGLVGGVALVAAGQAMAAAEAGKCGTFNQFTTSYYCVVCPKEKAQKWSACPGGDAGLIGLRFKKQGCTVTEYTKACGKK